MKTFISDFLARVDTIKVSVHEDRVFLLSRLGIGLSARELTLGTRHFDKPVKRPQWVSNYVTPRTVVVMDEIFKRESTKVVFEIYLTPYKVCLVRMKQGRKVDVDVVRNKDAEMSTIWD